MILRGDDKQPEIAFRASLEEAIVNLQGRLREILNRQKLTASDAEEAAQAAHLVGELIRIEEVGLRLLGVSEGTSTEPKRADSLEGLTLQEAARLVLNDAGIPLHARELGARIKSRGWRHPRSPAPKPDQIIFQLAARLPRYPDFVRVAPNTFALREHGFMDAPKRRPRPSLPSFDGPIGDHAATIADRDDEIFEDGASEWRS